MTLLQYKWQILVTDSVFIEKKQVPWQCMFMQLTQRLFHVCLDLSHCPARKSVCSPIRARQLFIYCCLSPIIVHKNCCDLSFIPIRTRQVLGNFCATPFT